MNGCWFDHLHALTLVNNLGLLLQAQDNLDLAEPFYRRALEGCERTFWPGHRSTLAAVENLRVLLKMMGKEMKGWEKKGCW
jgi:hypothetical protein